MKIRQITLKNYRNYETCAVSFSPKLNLIIGPNGQGKTNLLEALYVSGFGKSFRTSKDVEWIKLGEEATFIRLEYEKMGQSGQIEIKLLKNKKKEIKVNGVHLTKMSELIGYLNLVLFSPEDLRLVKESPGERRKFIDRELSHISPAYCHHLIRYNKILDQRNTALKQMNFQKKLSPELLDIWDEQLAEFGAHLILRRHDFIEKLSPVSAQIHSEITEEKENLFVNYICSIKITNFKEYDTIKSDFLETLSKNRLKDYERGFTQYGPHRDDLGLEIDGKELRTYGSQGQQRTAALALKLSEIEIIYNVVGEYPVLLLDDVMSELDVRRQNYLIKTFDKVQTIITTTEVGQIYRDHLQSGRLFEVSEGSIL